MLRSAFEYEVFGAGLGLVAGLVGVEDVLDEVLRQLKVELARLDSAHVARRALVEAHARHHLVVLGRRRILVEQLRVDLPRSGSAVEEVEVERVELEKQGGGRWWRWWGRWWWRWWRR